MERQQRRRESQVERKASSPAPVGPKARQPGSVRRRGGSLAVDDDPGSPLWMPRLALVLSVLVTLAVFYYCGQIHAQCWGVSLAAAAVDDDAASVARPGETNESRALSEGSVSWARYHNARPAWPAGPASLTVSARAYRAYGVEAQVAVGGSKTVLDFSEILKCCNF